MLDQQKPFMAKISPTIIPHSLWLRTHVDALRIINTKPSQTWNMQTKYFTLRVNVLWRWSFRVNRSVEFNFFVWSRRKRINPDKQRVGVWRWFYMCVRKFLLPLLLLSEYRKMIGNEAWTQTQEVIYKRKELHNNRNYERWTNSVVR